jgi:hypothetical protein
MTARRPRRPGGGRRWQRFVAMIVQRDLGKCHICGHYGATSADHLVTVEEDSSLFWKMSNAKAAHSYPNGCTDCTYAAKQLGLDTRPVYCNEIRNADSIERGRKRIEERTGLKLPEGGISGPSVEGRDW